MRRLLSILTIGVLLAAGGRLAFEPAGGKLTPPVPQFPDVVRIDEVEEEEPGETVLANLNGPFRCTIYYTPRESGFVAADGFDMTAETRTGLRDRKYARDFLRAVEKEGFGRLVEPVDGKAYIRYSGGSWGYAGIPLDCQDKPLVAKRSCAIKSGQRHIRQESKFRVCGRNVPRDFERLRWIVSDTGSGLENGQIDLYWGEDDPLGPGRRLSRPKTGPATIEEAALVVVR